MVRKGTLDEVMEILPQIPEFNNAYARSEFNLRLNDNPSLILVYEEEGVPVGFKCGYRRETSNNSFYSWMGAVLPDSRRGGVASRLLQAMEVWCRKNGYEELTFKTLNEHKAMLIFAIENGFEIFSVENRKGKEPRIWCSKKLI